MFIAPDGWMQFHLSRSHNGPEDKQLWVKFWPNTEAPSNVRLPGCSCRDWYSVERYEAEAGEIYRASLEPRVIYLCRCFGEFIE